MSGSWASGPLRPIPAACALAFLAHAPSDHAPDRRVVDRVRVGNAASEVAHGYVADNAVRGMVNGQSFRTARGWMRYALTTFDDTEVTVACTFVQDGATGGDMHRRYDVIVEDSLIASRTFSDSSAAPVVVELPVPFALTKGRTHIAVIVRAHGGPTPALSELRIIQDHNEIDAQAAPRATQLLQTR